MFVERSNYRPISILSCFSKIFETVLQVRLKSFLKLVGLPSKNQFGFQKKMTTYMAIANVMEEIMTSLDLNKSYKK